MKEREKIVLDYIVKFKTINGYSPTVREIANGLNTKSLSHISETLERLSERGYISYIKHKPRTIRVLKFE